MKICEWTRNHQIRTLDLIEGHWYKSREISQLSPIFLSTHLKILRNILDKIIILWNTEIYIYSSFYTLNNVIFYIYSLIYFFIYIETIISLEREWFWINIFLRLINQIDHLQSYHIIIMTCHKNHEIIMKKISRSKFWHRIFNLWYMIENYFSNSWHLYQIWTINQDQLFYLRW